MRVIRSSASVCGGWGRVAGEGEGAGAGEGDTLGLGTRRGGAPEFGQFPVDRFDVDAARRGEQRDERGGGHHRLETAPAAAVPFNQRARRGGAPAARPVVGGGPGGVRGPYPPA